LEIPQKDSAPAPVRKLRGGGALAGLNAYQKHQKFIKDYIIHYGREKELTKPLTTAKTDYDVLRENYRFKSIWFCFHLADSFEQKKTMMKPNGIRGWQRNTMTNSSENTALLT
jgi:hypothetical protein